jgi:hypothetical protein
VANYQTGNAAFDNFKLTDSVATGGAYIEGEPPANLFALQSCPVSMSVAAIGTPAPQYQWSCNGTPLSDNGRIVGSQTSVLTILAPVPGDSGSYTVYVHNTAGSATSTACALTVGAFPLSFNGNNMQAWMGCMNSQGNWLISSPLLANGLELTDGNGDECSSAWFPIPQYIGAFQASFIYTPTASGNSYGGVPGMGACFVVQNDPRGTNAIGQYGGINLGVEGNPAVSPSAELCIQIYGTIGMSWAEDGIVPLPFPTGNVNLVSYDPIEVSMTYENGYLALSVTDTNASTPVAFNTNLYVGNITSVLGTNTAYVGFVGSDVTSTSTQTITDFTFVSFPQLSISRTSANGVLVSWPESFGGYVLQQTTNLSAGTWTPVSNQSQETVANGMYQLAVTPATGGVFYRLSPP